MILSTFQQSYDACKITDSILNNKVLFFSVYREAWQIIAEAKLLTIREIVDHPASGIGEVIAKTHSTSSK